MPAAANAAPEAQAEHPMLAKVDALWNDGAKIRALGMLRRAARKAPNDAALHQALATRAEQTSAWGWVR
jgi:hypothetical protein